MGNCKVLSGFCDIKSKTLSMIISFGYLELDKIYFDRFMIIMIIALDDFVERLKVDHDTLWVNMDKLKLFIKCHQPYFDGYSFDLIFL